MLCGVLAASGLALALGPSAASGQAHAHAGARARVASSARLQRDARGRRRHGRRSSRRRSARRSDVLLRSIGQISPRALRELRRRLRGGRPQAGPAGPTGATGVRGAVGASPAGASGGQGAAGASGGVGALGPPREVELASAFSVSTNTAAEEFLFALPGQVVGHMGCLPLGGTALFLVISAPTGSYVMSRMEIEAKPSGAAPSLLTPIVTEAELSPHESKGAAAELLRSSEEPAKIAHVSGTINTPTEVVHLEATLEVGKELCAASGAVYPVAL